jgi:hypothetical protein
LGLSDLYFTETGTANPIVRERIRQMARPID